MGYKEKYRTDDSWWNEKKTTYLPPPEWLQKIMDAVPAINEHVSVELSGAMPVFNAKPGDVGVVFWHEEDGKTIIPVGLIYRDGKHCSFAYHPEYAADPDTQPISHTLPKDKLVHTQHDVEEHGIIPFFDNLVAEGWLGMHQTNALYVSYGIDHELPLYKSVENFKNKDHGRPEERFLRLLDFGRGFHGAVSIVDITASDERLKQEEASLEEALSSSASIGGGEPKALAVKDENGFHIAQHGETTTHIVKFTNKQTPDSWWPLNNIQNEYLNIIASQQLLPEDDVIEAELAEWQPKEGQRKAGLFIKRFDRNEKGGRIHFEEALQVLGATAENMNNYAFADLLEIGKKLDIPNSGEILFKRTLSAWMLGNADGHAKNYAVWNRDGKWSWTPGYDLERTNNQLSPDGEPMDAIPMRIGHKKFSLSDIGAKEIFLLGKELELSADETKRLIDHVRSHIPRMKEAIESLDNPLITNDDKQAFHEQFDNREKGLFAGLEVAYQQAKAQERRSALGG